MDAEVSVGARHAVPATAPLSLHLLNDKVTLLRFAGYGLPFGGGVIVLDAAMYSTHLLTS